MLTVEKAAIRTDDGSIYYLDRPARHNDVIRFMRESGYTGLVGGERQGFLLSNGMFVRRKPALGVARRAGQITIEKCHAPGIGLFSEDLW